MAKKKKKKKGKSVMEKLSELGKGNKPERKSSKEKLAAEAICPGCGKEVETHKCRFCGAVKSINDVSGNVIWMRNGRVVAAFQDEKQAYVKMAERYGIPKDRWPAKFKGGE